MDEANARRMMNTFGIVEQHLREPGIIPGARGHKKEVIPVGTKVYCIMYGRKYFWCCYLNERQAIQCRNGLESNLLPSARRRLTLEQILDWNFRYSIPTRVARVK